MRHEKKGMKNQATKVSLAYRARGGRTQGKRWAGRLLCGGLSACLLVQAVPMTALADVAKVTVDETMYVNLSYYGAVNQVNVVKGLTFNNVYDYTDYGNYTKVQNMSDETDPVVGDGKVTWKAPEKSNKFFFEGTMKADEAEIPWRFDVTYRVNGVVTDADQLAGASGLIGIDIDAYPVTSVNDYMRNNMLLFVAVPVDMAKCYSIEAPGAQMQTIGEETAVIFTALPGEEGHFTVNIGTDSFETIGAIMMMAPGTVSSLEHLKDLNETKNTFREDAEAVMDDVEDMMDNVVGMQTQLDQMSDVLNALERANQKVQTAEDSIFAGMDVSIGDLETLSQDLTPVDTFLRTAQWTVYDLNQWLNETNQDILAVNSRIKTLNKSLRRIGSTMDGAEVSTEGLEEELSELQSALEGLMERLQTQQETLEKYETQLEEQMAALPDGMTTELLKQVMGGLQTQLEAIREKVAALEERLNHISGNAGDLMSAAGSLSGTLNDLMGDGASASFQLARLMNEMGSLTGDLDTLATILDSYYPDVQEALEESTALIDDLQTAGQNLTALLTTVNETAKSISPDLNQAANQSIAAGKGAVDNTQDMLQTTEHMKQSVRDLRETVETELDQTESENNFLNIDPQARKISLTSEKNQEPSSIQIICRTDEISVDDTKDELLDAEAVREANMNPFQRILLVFKRIIQAVADVVGSI